MSEDKTELVSGKTIERYVLRLERETLRKYGRSLSASTLLSRITPYVVEVRMGEDMVVMRVGWRAALRDAQERYINQEEDKE